MNREELIEKLKELVKEIKPSLVRRKEQIKGLIWIFENGLACDFDYDDIFKIVKEHYK